MRRVPQLRSAWPPARSARSRLVFGERDAVPAAAGVVTEGLGDHRLADADGAVEDHRLATVNEAPQDCREVPHQFLARTSLERGRRSRLMPMRLRTSRLLLDINSAYHCKPTPSW